jgi:rod shape-determining protein MreC
VLVITSTEPRFPPQDEKDLAASATEESTVPAGVKDQMKASEIMAEKLPGLIDPNLPPDQQPLNDDSNPNPAPRPPQPLHPDEFSPSANDDSNAGPGADSTPKRRILQLHRSAQVAGQAAVQRGRWRYGPAPNSNPQTTPRRNP